MKNNLQVWLGDMGPLRLISNDGLVGRAGPSTPMPAPSGSGTNQDFVVTVTSLSNQSVPAGSGPNLREPPSVTFIAVELPTIPEILRALLDSVRRRGIPCGDHLTPETNVGAPRGRQRNDDGIQEAEETNDELWKRDPALPLLFVRGSDGIGFHSGYALRCIPATAPASPNVDGWSIHVSRVESLDHTSSA
jgi:recombining binding protein (suppressor of hairless)